MLGRLQLAGAFGEVQVAGQPLIAKLYRWLAPHFIAETHNCTQIILFSTLRVKHRDYQNWYFSANIVINERSMSESNDFFLLCT